MIENNIFETGKRKSAIARIRIVTSGTGKFTINNKSIDSYFPSDILKNFITEPIKIANMDIQLDIFVNVRGGGIVGKAGAIRHAISKGLIKYDDKLKPTLKNLNMLTRDSRVKERKKSGQPGARKKFQFSKR